jgi:uncharacterized protein YjbI with pentapeptide repeats
VNATFVKAELAGAFWKDCKMLGADFSGLKGLGWTLASTVLMYANMRNCDLSGRTLSGLDLTEADLSYADFSRTVF